MFYCIYIHSANSSISQSGLWNIIVGYCVLLARTEDDGLPATTKTSCTSILEIKNDFSLLKSLEL